MRRSAFWLMSNPIRDPQFSRGWTYPPPLNRKRRPAGTGTAKFIGKSNTAIDTIEREKAQARRAAEALFGRAGAA